ncbi:MAG: glycosyltransferase family 4 protein [Candidatus Hydrogenedentes bacterium]|nr:glycosyltransferase family 4 protein [Candidatus Hydrogenedentota bacterium]
MTLRIAVVGACPYPVPQGSQVFLRDTASALRDRGHEVHLVVYAFGRVGEEGDGLAVHRCANLPLGRRTAAGPSLAKPAYDAALVRTLRRVVREHRIDAVYAHNYEGLAVALAARARPVVYQAHNAMADELPYYFRWKWAAGRFGGRLDRWLPRRADRVIAPHAALAEYLLACGCRPARVSVIAPAVDTAAFEPPCYGDEPAPVLYTGNLDGYQNLGLLAEAMGRLRARVPEARLIVATAADGGTARTRFPEAEIVATPDFASVRRVLATDAVVACPRVSWSGYPIKLLNAMAAGRPAVACRSAAHPLDDDATGLVVDDGDAEGFAEALARLVTERGLRERLGRAAREAAGARHDPAAAGAALEGVIASACGASEGRRGAPRP